MMVCSSKAFNVSCHHALILVLIPTAVKHGLSDRQSTDVVVGNRGHWTACAGTMSPKIFPPRNHNNPRQFMLLTVCRVLMG
jgi:hypothetical protein